jgi:uncharacterized protein YaaN involved in tellurite resistance
MTQDANPETSADLSVESMLDTKPLLNIKASFLDHPMLENVPVENVPVVNPMMENVPVLTNSIQENDLLPYSNLTDDQKARVEQYANTVSLRDPAGNAAFAAKIQRDFSSHLDGLLEGIRTSDIGEAGALVTELSRGLRKMNLKAMQSEVTGGWRSKLVVIPVVGKMFSEIARLSAMHEPIKKHLGEIEQKANLNLGKLKANSEKMERLLDVTEPNLIELRLALIGGQQALLSMREEFKVERERVLTINDPVQLAFLRDMAEQINSFETRLVRLKIYFAKSLSSIPQIRLTQQASRIEFQNTLDTILTDIPAIKAAIVRIATLNQISKATDSSAARRKLSRDLEELGTNMLEVAYVKAKTTQGDMAEDVASFSRVVDKLISLDKKGAEMDEQNRRNRQDAESKIGEILKHYVTTTRETASRATGI